MRRGRSVDPVAAKTRFLGIIDDHLVELAAASFDDVRRTNVAVVAEHQDRAYCLGSNDDQRLAQYLAGVAHTSKAWQHAVANVTAALGEKVVEREADG